MANLNLAGFKKLKEDKKTVTMGHPTGHSITILKSKLPAIQRKQLERLPMHLAAGDPSVGSDEQPVANPNPSVSPEPLQTDSGSAPSSDPGIEAPSPGAPPTPVSYQEPDSSDLSAPDPNLPGAGQPIGGEPEGQQSRSVPIAGSPVDLNSAYGQAQRGIHEQQDVSSQLTQARADVEQNDIAARQALQESFAKNSKDFQAHQQQFIEDYKNNHIDPNHYQENMGTGQKVATAIGLLLGGFTGGFNRTGVNPAADWLNGQINRDIEAQKSRLDQQKTLLGANQELYHDNLLANNATRAQMNDLYGHQIQLAADKLGTPQAKAAADKALSALAFDKSQALNQASLRATVLQAIHNSQGAGVSPFQMGVAGLMSPDQAQKEQASYDKQHSIIKNINRLYGEAQQLGLSSKIPYTEKASALARINAEIGNNVLSEDAAKRLSPLLQENFIKPFTVNADDFLHPNTIAQKNNSALLKAQDEHAAEMPITGQIAKAALPNYGAIQQNQKPQYKVGQIVYSANNDKKGQVQPDGSVKPVR